MRRGFTLAELMIVIGTIGILAGIVVTAVNPKKHIADATVAKRQAVAHDMEIAMQKILVDPGSATAAVKEILSDFQQLNVPEVSICANDGAPGYDIAQNCMRLHVLEQENILPPGTIALAQDTSTSPGKTWLKVKYSPGGIVTVTPEPLQVPREKTLYWTDSTAKALYKQVPGGSPELVLGNLTTPRGLTVDQTAHQLYLADNNKIWKIDLSNGTSQVFITDASLVDVAVYPTANTLYWSRFSALYIRQSDLTTPAMQEIIFSGNNPENIAVDEVHNKIYWIHALVPALISRENLDGTGREPIIGSIHGLQRAMGITIDPDEQKLYWADVGTDTISRSDLDGSNVEVIISGLNNPAELAFDPALRLLYWAERGARKIRKMSLDSPSTITDLVTNVDTFDVGLAN